MRSLSQTVANLIAARVLAQVPSVRLRVFTDHSVPTFDPFIEVSTYPLHQFYAEGREVAFLNDVTFPVETMAHLPSPITSGTDTLSRRIAFKISNAPYEGTDTFYDYLTQNGRLDGAEVLLRSAIVPPQELTRNAPGSGVGVDGATSQGDPVEWFEGTVSRVTSVGSEIQCEASSNLPSVAWKHVPDDGSDPRDRGQRLPIPLGAKAIVRCVNLVVGATSILAQRLQIGAGDVQLEDASDFPNAGTAMFGAEAISWTNKIDNSLTGLITRGALGSVESDHIVGTGVIETAEVVLGIAGIPASGVTGLFIQSAITNTTIEVPKLLYSVNYDDESTLPGTAGDGITTITLSDLQLASLLNEIFADAAVTLQSEYSVDELAAIQVATDAFPFPTAVLLDQGSGATGGWSALPDPVAFPQWNYDKQSSVQEGFSRTFTSGLSQNLLANFITCRFNFTVDVAFASAPITFGLRLFGAENVLANFADGTVVVTGEVKSGGFRTFQGVQLAALPGMTLADIAPVRVEFLKSEVSGGNPSIRVDVTDVSMTYAYEAGALIEVETFKTFDTFTNIQGSLHSQTWEDVWEDLGTSTPSQTEKGTGLPYRMEAEFLSDPMNGDQIEKLQLVFRSHGDNEGLSNFIHRFDFSQTDWAPVVENAQNYNFSMNHFANQVSEYARYVTLAVVPGATTADLVGVKCFLENGGNDSGSGNQNFHECKIVGLNITTYVAGAVGEPIDRTVDSQIQASAGGAGLQFYAVVDGPLAPDSSYNAATGDLMNTPGDLIQYWIREVGGFALADVDAAGTFTDSATDLAGYEWGFDARNLGATFAEILVRMGYEARSNVARPSGGPWKMLQANASGAFAAPTTTIDSMGSEHAIGKDDSAIRTRLTVYFDFDPRFDSANSQSFLSVQTTDPAVGAVITREAEFGRADADPMFLFCHTAAAGVTDWREYHEQELGRFSFILDARVDHWQAFALEIGDIVTLETSSVGSLKARVIETRHSDSQGWLIKFVQVL